MHVLIVIKSFRADHTSDRLICEIGGNNCQCYQILGNLLSTRKSLSIPGILSSFLSTQMVSVR